MVYQFTLNSKQENNKGLVCLYCCICHNIFLFFNQGIFTNGGAAPNIIPEEAELTYYLRALNEGELAIVKRKVLACAEGAAVASECKVSPIVNPPTRVTTSQGFCMVVQLYTELTVYYLCTITTRCHIAGWQSLFII